MCCGLKLPTIALFLNQDAIPLPGGLPEPAFKPKAFVTVKAVQKIATPSLKLAAFDLGKVTLKNDAHGHETQFVENRDKFINTLAKTDPNSFLYMFRHAFGQKQPEGAKPLGVWDSKETKLRGHAQVITFRQLHKPMRVQDMIKHFRPISPKKWSIW